MSTSIVISLLIASVLTGGVVVSTMHKSKNEQLIKILLAFSGGFLLSIAFIHFIPELYEHSELNIGLFILIGFLVQLILEFFSGGIEHGHVHIHKNSALPIGMIVALCLHSFIEGIPLGTQLMGHEIATSHHHHNDNSFLLGILFHKIPVAIALMTLLFASKVSRNKAWGVLLVFAIAAPIGVVLGIYSDQFVQDFDFDIILAIVVGMFLHISTTIIFETSENHKFNFVKLLAILGGAALAFLMH